MGVRPGPAVQDGRGAVKGEGVVPVLDVTRVLEVHVTAETNGVRPLDFGRIGHVLVYRLDIFQRRIRRAHGGEIADGEIRNAASPRQGAVVGAGNSQHIQAVPGIGQVWKKQLMLTPFAPSRLYNERPTDHVSSGPGNRQPGAVLQVVSRAGLPKTPRT